MRKDTEIDFYDPFKSMQKNFFDDFFEPFSNFRFPEIRTPLANVEDKGKNIEVNIELPGIKKENINVDAHQDYIKISAKTKNEKENKNKKYYRYEMQASSFSRVIPMPQKIISDKVSGELKEGILKLTAPKKDINNMGETKKVLIK